MKNLFFKLWAKITGRNSGFTPAGVILGQMNEPRPLPMGRQEFEDWSDRIISGALLPGTGDPKVFVEGQKFALANMIMHLGPTESHKPDTFFIHSLRKHAINQVADTIRKEIHEAAKVRLAAEEALKKEAEEAESESDEPILIKKSEELSLN